MLTLTADTLVLAGLGILFLTMLVVGTWLSARIRRTARDIEKMVASMRQVPLTVTPALMPSRPSGPFLERQQEVYAGLYARYRRASESAIPRPDRTPDFAGFSRDELLRYLARRKLRERDAKDAIAALDRGDTFAMTRLMARLHEKVNERDAGTALERATHFEAIHELYLSDPVRAAIAVLRERLAPEESPAHARGERRTQNTAPMRATENEIREALASVQRAMRDELGGDHATSAVPKVPSLPVRAEQPLIRQVHDETARAATVADMPAAAADSRGAASG